jgi:23S rRNA pseudouridine1911/1915/1917 synthase
VTSYLVSPEHAGMRLDQFLTAAIGDVSRARVQQLIEQGKVEVGVNGKAAPARASYKLRGDESIRLLGPAQPPPLKATPENIPLDVVHEDDAIAVVNKPAGMMVHAGAGMSADDEDDPDPRTHGTLVNALLFHFKKLSSEGGELRPGIVHRLDKDTSGLIVVAKTDAAHRKLAEQFASRGVKKTYLALVHGMPKSPQGTINLPVGRDPSRRHRMAAKAGMRDGRDAVTHYKMVREFDTHYGKFALLEVRIETGRTHQIRVHLASLGHPVVGDHLYGAARAIEPLDSARKRARPMNTKATRDRATSDLARMLSEARESGVRSGMSPALKKPGRTSALAALNPISLDRNFLHAAEIGFTHPKSGKPVRYQRDLPPELGSFLEQLAHLTR